MLKNRRYFALIRRIQEAIIRRIHAALLRAAGLPEPH